MRVSEDGLLQLSNTPTISCNPRATALPIQGSTQHIQGTKQPPTPPPYTHQQCRNVLPDGAVWFIPAAAVVLSMPRQLHAACNPSTCHQHNTLATLPLVDVADQTGWGVPWELTQRKSCLVALQRLLSLEQLKAAYALYQFRIPPHHHHLLEAYKVNHHHQRSLLAAGPQLSPSPTGDQTQPLKIIHTTQTPQACIPSPLLLPTYNRRCTLSPPPSPYTPPLPPLLLLPCVCAIGSQGVDEGCCE